MKDLRSIYRLADKKNIAILPFRLPSTGSMALSLEDGTCCIGLDEEILETAAQHRTHLYHEMGHCLTGSFYNRYAAVEYRQKHENRADRWAIRKLISKEELDTAVAQGHTELWDLAEHFGVTEDFIRKTICLYTHGNLATELYF